MSVSELHSSLTRPSSIRPLILHDRYSSASVAAVHCHCEAFLWEQALGSDALLALQPGRLHIEPYQLPIFSHASHPRAPELCFAKFDERQSTGLDTFTKEHDPYWDVPLNENLPQPVIDLPIPSEPVVREQAALFGGKDSGITDQKSRGRERRERKGAR